MTNKKFKKLNSWKWMHDIYTCEFKKGRKKIESQVYPILLQEMTDVPGRDAHRDHVLSVSWPHKKNELYMGGMEKKHMALIESAPDLFNSLYVLADEIHNLNLKNSAIDKALDDAHAALTKAIGKGPIDVLDQLVPWELREGIDL